MKNNNFIRINNILYSKANFLSLLNQNSGIWMEALVDFLRSWFDDRHFIEVQTSGSTGMPKTIRLKKQSMINSSIMTCDYFNLSEDNTVLLCLPADYIAGKMMIVRAIVSGFNLVVVKPSANPFEEVDEIIDFTAITPFQFINSYQTIQNKPIRKMIIGGSSVSLRLQKLMEDLETDIYETYGMTETCSHIALRKLNGQNASDYFEVLPNIEIHQDIRKCLVIKAPALTDDELVTNDVVEMPNSSYFKWLGRYDNVINTGGIKIFPEQVEKKIEPFLERRFFIGYVPDEKLNQKVIMIIEGNPLSTIENKELQTNLDSALNKFEKPKQIHFIDSFEVSSSGKILKNKMLLQIQEKA